MSTSVGGQGPESTDGFEGATLVETSFRNARIRFSDLRGLTMRGVYFDVLDIDSHDLAESRLIVNGVDVSPLVEAELDRLLPGRALRLGRTPEELQEGWAAVQAAWATTVADTPRELVGRSVDDEWSLAQTLRHLVLATDAWLGGAVREEAQPFHAIGLGFASAEEMGLDPAIFRTDEPSYDEVLAVRADRQQLVTDFLGSVTPELLAEERADPWGSEGWSPTVGDCLRVILDEEWAHLRYARRDLALLGAG